MRAAGHVDLRHDLIAADGQDDPGQAVAGAAARGRPLAQQARELLGAHVALLAAPLEGDAAVALPTPEGVDADSQRGRGGPNADGLVHGDASQRRTVTSPESAVGEYSGSFQRRDADRVWEVAEAHVHEEPAVQRQR